ncbi:protein NRT1/ PTR FAMILY 6.4-like [Rutidosis leptorrhynchoides]|uniref:protein NRT1/ PTR FAMILY 6.4-like n=1 Tax=Rutidosis leptorrhynchoides TaxID=125765 RepID=UPI003A9A4046
MSIGLFLSTLAMGYFMSSVLVSLIDMAIPGKWLTNDLIKGKLENFYWVLAILGVINFVVFLVLASRHPYKVKNLNVQGIKGATLLTIATSLPSIKPPRCVAPTPCEKAIESQLAMLYAVLYTIALGASGIKSNVSGFGSDQFDTSDPKEEKVMIYFFNRFYFYISLGSLFAVTVLVCIQDNVGRGLGYGISAETMIIVVIVLFDLYGEWFFGDKEYKSTIPANPTALNEYSNSKVPHTTKFRALDKADEKMDISAFWLAPRFSLVGAGEAFAYVGQLEFFIREAPQRTKSMSTGLFLSTLAMRYFMSSVLVSLTDMATPGKWLTDDLNKHKLQNFYWVLAILGVRNFVVFLVLASRHPYKVQNYNGQDKDIENWNAEMIEGVEVKKAAIGGEGRSLVQIISHRL